MPLRQTLSEFYPPHPTFTGKDLPDLAGKVYIITGGTSGIGLALAKILYGKNAKVYITSRSDGSANSAISDIKASVVSAGGGLKCLVIDLSDLDTIAPAVKQFLAQEPLLHVAWFNAGVMRVPDGSVTKQGYELQWGTNVVAHFIMSDGIDWEDINKKPSGWKREKGAMTYYGQRKVGNVRLAKELAKRHGDRDVVTVALNPGHLKTNLQRNSGFAIKIYGGLVLHDPRLGALTELYAGFSKDIGLGNNGAYVIPWGRLGKTRPDIEKVSRYAALARNCGIF